jgi:chain length determinant protein EpsF
MNLRQILLILRLRWWLILGTFVLALTAAGIYLAVAERSYVAKTSLIVELRTDPLLTALAPALGAQGYLATQVEILQSDRTAARVVKALGLVNNPKAVELWKKATDGKDVPLEVFLAKLVQRGLKAEASNRGSQMINLEFTATDPKIAAAAVNAFADAYIAISSEVRATPSKENASFFEERLKSLRTELETAQNKVAAFQRARGVVISNERYDQETSRLASLEAAYAAALAEQASTSSIARNSNAESADVSQNPAVVALRAQLVTAESRLAEASLTLGASHPTRIQFESQVRELREQLQRETRLAAGSSASVNRVASAKLGELRALVEAQKRTIVNLRNVRDEGGMLLRELESAQRAYDSVAQRRSQASMEAQADSGVARVLNPAVTPYTPTSPRVPLVIAGAAILGLLVGVAIAIGLELVDRRVRSPEDLAAADNVPLLGVLSSKPGTTVPRISPNRSTELLLPNSAGQPPRLTMSEGST